MRWRVAEFPITLENRSDHLEGPVNFVALNDERRRAPDYALGGFFAEDAKFFQGFTIRTGSSVQLDANPEAPGRELLSRQIRLESCVFAGNKRPVSRSARPCPSPSAGFGCGVSGGEFAVLCRGRRIRCSKAKFWTRLESHSILNSL